MKKQTMKKAPAFPLKICFWGGKVLLQKLTFCPMRNKSHHKFIKCLSSAYLPTSQRESAHTRSLSWEGNRQQIPYFRINLTFQITNSSKAPATTKQWLMALPDFKYRGDRQVFNPSHMLLKGWPPWGLRQTYIPTSWSVAYSFPCF